MFGAWLAMSTLNSSARNVAGSGCCSRRLGGRVGAFGAHGLEGICGARWQLYGGGRAIDGHLGNGGSLSDVSRPCALLAVGSISGRRCDTFSVRRLAMTAGVLYFQRLLVFLGFERAKILGADRSHWRRADAGGLGIAGCWGFVSRQLEPSRMFLAGCCSGWCLGFLVLSGKLDFGSDPSLPAFSYESVNAKSSLLPSIIDRLIEPRGEEVTYLRSADNRFANWRRFAVYFRRSDRTRAERRWMAFRGYRVVAVAVDLWPARIDRFRPDGSHQRRTCKTLSRPRFQI